MKGFESISSEKFEEFHRSFQGEFFELCAECGGKCEYAFIATLLPGEKDYIARLLGQPLSEFENKYLDKIILLEGTTDVMKLGGLCGALDEQHRCVFTKINAKPVICKIYPLCLRVTKRGEFRSYVDSWCPLFKRGEIRKYFKNEGTKYLQVLGISNRWIKAVSQYEHWYDYQKLLQIRKLPLDKYETFDLGDVLKCKV